jgi:aminoglycoside phosphotransferase (APT) family kinase protein
LRRVVLRAHGPTHGGHDAQLEYDLLRAVARLGLPVPEALAADASCRHLAYPYVILSFAEGESIFPESSADRCIAEMAQTLADIHDSDVASLPPQLPKLLRPLPELLEFWPQGPEFDALRVRLLDADVEAYDGAPVLLHGDFWPANLIWRDGRIAAILDWENAALGDPLADVACTDLELRYLVGAAGAQEFRNAYVKRRPVPARRFALWQVYVAAAAQHFMGKWGLEPAKEAHMRRTALSALRDAAATLS